MLEALDKLASDLDMSRPEALRFAFAEWAVSTGFSEKTWLQNERPVMISLPNDQIAAIDELFADEDRAEAVEHVVREWLVAGGHLKPQK
ncbi:hypothetical protein J2X50_000809 [Aminobacter sp. BE322]